MKLTRVDVNKIGTDSLTKNRVSISLACSIMRNVWVKIDNSCTKVFIRQWLRNMENYENKTSIS